VDADLVATRPSAAAARPVAAGDATPRSLTRRASLNAAAALVDYAAKATVTLAVTPILVGGLGRTLYGIWEILARLGGYLSVTDGRPTEALRLVIAQRQGSADAAGNRRQVGATLAVWALTLPIVLAAGAVLAWWLAPALTKAPPHLVPEIRATALLLVLSFLVTGLASVPESTLCGMNQGYRRLGVQTGLNVMGGGLAALAVWSGLGLVGLGQANLLRVMASGVAFWLLARRHVRWFGAANPTRLEVRSLLGMSVWLTAGDALAKILLASDVIILGAVLTPAAVAPFALTGYAARTALGLHIFAVGAAMPGIGGLLGRGETGRALQARGDLLTLTWAFATAVGATILMWNRSFVGLWVGQPYYAGVWVDLLIVLAFTQTVFIRTDAYVIDAALRPRLRVIVAAAAAVLMIGLSIVLTDAFGAIGLCAGLLAGRAVQSVVYPILVRASLPNPARAPRSFRSLRRAAVTAALFTAALGLGRSVHAASWVPWVAGMMTTAGCATGFALALGLSRAERDAMLRRVRSVREASPR